MEAEEDTHGEQGEAALLHGAGEPRAMAQRSIWRQGLPGQRKCPPLSRKYLLSILQANQEETLGNGPRVGCSVD